ncbi:hypothetical protein SNE35_28765 [Paucibacter sp. R3-3]|uniref:Uncharacterized protein n=1 Tax=Roseateles agri TaxID=3098619 RepID=A0ABU5DTH4_9BURK|nr:hypothetical protein [Paucibacter sp. R3-3]MDY0748527.1 hypothetical protein [Paucibacter sp. R3-3]
MHAATQTPIQPGAGRLVEDWQSHLKFAGREPRTLAELAVARADHEHRSRLAEIRKLGTKLTQLDAFIAPLAAKGIKLNQRHITTYDDGKTIRVQTAMGQRNDDALHQALLELGFREIERSHMYSTTDMLTLKHGRSLFVKIDVSQFSTGQAATDQHRAVSWFAQRRFVRLCGDQSLGGKPIQLFGRGRQYFVPAAA